MKPDLTRTVYHHTDPDVRHVAAYLDGENVKRCVTADTEKGYVIVS